MAMKRKYTQEEVEKHMLGRSYYNPDDLNIFVRRRGLGSWTMNLGIQLRGRCPGSAAGPAASVNI